MLLTMQVAILSRQADCHATRRLLAEGQRRGHQPIIVDVTHCHLLVEESPQGRPTLRLRHQGQTLESLGGVIPRLGVSVVQPGLAVLRQAQAMGIACLNSPDSFARARDKLSCIQHLAAAGLRVPATQAISTPADASDVVDSLGAPLVLKLTQGSQGVGVLRADSRASAHSTLQTLAASAGTVLAQRYVGEAGGADLRVLVVGGRVVAAMQRQAMAGDFRANLHQGGHAKMHQPSPAEAELALAAVACLGLEVAGVDLLQTPNGPLILEVNPCPGLEGIEAATGVDAAAAIWARMEAIALAAAPLAP